MALGCLSTLALIVTAIAAGMGYFSFWWVLIPAFFAGSFALSNGPGYGAIIEANRQGRVWYFPMMLALSISLHVAVAGGIYWIAGQLS